MDVTKHNNVSCFRHCVAFITDEMDGAHDSVFDLRQDRDPVKWPKIPSEFKDYVKKEEAKKRGKR